MNATLFLVGLPFLFGVVVCSVAPAWGCDCGEIPCALVAMGTDHAVFSGTVLERHDPASGEVVVNVRQPVEYKIEIEEVWKGELSDVVTVRSPRDGSSCGYPFKVGEAYLVYATTDHRVGLRTGLCTRTKLLAEAGADLAELALIGVRGPGEVVEAAVVDHFVRELASDEEAVQLQAAKSLLALRAHVESATSVLTEVYGTGSAVDRAKTIRVWDRLGGASRVGMPILRKASEDESEDVRLAAVTAMRGRSSETEAVVPCLKRALDDPSPAVRAEATRILGAMVHAADQVVPALAKALGDEDDGVRLAAVGAVGSAARDSAHVAPLLLEAAHDPNDEVRAKVVLQLGWLGPGAEGVLPALEEAQDDPEPEVRVSAAHALRRMGWHTPDALQLLCRSLLDPEENVRLAAIAGIVWLATFQPEVAGTVGALAGALENDDESIRSKAAEGLGGITSDTGGAVSALGEALKDPSSAVRSAAAASLGRQVGRRADYMEALIGVLEDEDGRVRLAAVQAMGRLGEDGAQAIPALTEALYDDDLEVCRAAKDALARVKGER